MVTETEQGFFPGNDWAGNPATLGRDVQDALSCEMGMGRQIGVQRLYTPAGSTSVHPAVADAVRRGRKVYVEFSLLENATSNYAAGAAGKLDKWVQTIADNHVAIASNLLVVFQHEADLGPGTAGDYRAWQKRVRNILRATSPDYRLVVNQTVNGFHTKKPKGLWTPDPADFDVLGIDGYNGKGKRWRSFADLFGEFHDYAVSLGKPWSIGETMCEEGKTGGLKPVWIRDAGVTIQAWNALGTGPEFVCFTHHWKGGAETNNLVTTSPASTQAFIDLVHSAAFTG